MMKKILLALCVFTLVCVLALTFVACGGSKDEVTDKQAEQYLKFELLGDDTYEVSPLHYDVPYRVVIPATYNGKAVTAIADEAFHNNLFIEEIVIPSSITSIGDDALESANLKVIDYKGTLSQWCALEGLAEITAYYREQTIIVDGNELRGDLVIPSGVTEIPDDAFRGCMITSVTIPNTVKRIGSDAFYRCTSLTSVTIPSSVTSIGGDAFRSCYALVEVCNKSDLEITKGGSNNGYVGYYAREIYTGEYTSKVSVDKDGYLIYTDGEEKILIGYNGADKALTIPAGITEIAAYAFYDTESCLRKITSVTIPSSVKSIGNYAFYYCCKLTSVTFTGESKLESIGDYAFYYCKSLTSIKIPASVTEIGSYAFRYCRKLSSVTFAEGSELTSIGSCAFGDCDKVVSFTLPSKLESIGYGAFQENDTLTTVTIPVSVTSIGGYVFSSCSNLTTINYQGTKAQWESISKEYNWTGYDVANYTIRCTDGDITTDSED